MKKIVTYIDEASIKEKTDKEVFCAVVIEDKYLDEYRDKITSLRQDILDDPLYSSPFCGNNNQKALKKAFHMTEISPETRERFLELIRYFSFEVLIYIYDNTDEEDVRRCKYLKTLYKRLRQRYEETEINIIWENDSKKIHFPSDIPIKRIDKGGDALLEIADCIAWIFCRKYYGNYIYKEDFEKNRDKRYYAMFEDKIRFIKDDMIKKPFTKNNPLP